MIHAFPILDIIPVICRYLRPRDIMGLRAVNHYLCKMIDSFGLERHWNTEYDYCMERFTSIRMRVLTWPSIGYMYSSLAHAEDNTTCAIYCSIHRIDVGQYCILHLHYQEGEGLIYLTASNYAKYAIYLWGGYFMVLTTLEYVYMCTYIDALCEYHYNDDCIDSDNIINIEQQGLAAMLCNVFEKTYKYKPITCSNKVYMKFSTRYNIADMINNYEPPVKTPLPPTRADVSNTYDSE